MVKLKYWYKMADEIKIIITNQNGKVITQDNRYLSYNFDIEYGVLAGGFKAALVDPRDTNILPGDEILFQVNDKIEFRGIIQRRERTVSKGEVVISISGKDRGSILVENYANIYKDYENTAPKTIINALIGQTNFYTKEKGFLETIADLTGFSNPVDLANRNAAVLEDIDNSDTLTYYNEKTEYDANFTALSAIESFKVSPGDQIFTKISEIVTTAGYEILYEQNGTLYIGDLNKKRKADDVKYSTTLRYDGIGNDILNATLTEDDSGRYSSVQISSQSETEDSDGYVNTLAVAKDNTLNNVKFFAQNVNIKDDTNDVVNPSKMAIQIREEQRIAGYQLKYTVDGHIAKNGYIWKVNRYCDVVDEPNQINKTLVIYAVTYNFDENSGTTTTLNLSLERSDELIYNGQYYDGYDRSLDYFRR